MYLCSQMRFMSKYFERISAILFLAAYIVVSFPLFHAHEEEHHHEEHAGTIHESDACHNFIYHGIAHDQEHSHDHASSFNHECFTCQFFQNNPVEPVTANFKLAFDISDHVQMWTGPVNLLQNTAFHFSLRGPPALV